MFTDEEYCLHNSVCFNIETIGPVLNRESKSDFNEKATKATFITQQDVRNVVRKLENSLKYCHQSDAISLDCLVKELQLEQGNPIIASNLRYFGWQTGYLVSALGIAECIGNTWRPP